MIILKSTCQSTIVYLWHCTDSFCSFGIRPSRKGWWQRNASKWINPHVFVWNSYSASGGITLDGSKFQSAWLLWVIFIKLCKNNFSFARLLGGLDWVLFPKLWEPSNAASYEWWIPAVHVRCLTKMSRSWSSICWTAEFWKKKQKMILNLLLSIRLCGLFVFKGSSCCFNVFDFWLVPICRSIGAWEEGAADFLVNTKLGMDGFTDLLARLENLSHILAWSERVSWFGLDIWRCWPNGLSDWNSASKWGEFDLRWTAKEEFIELNCHACLSPSHEAMMDVSSAISWLAIGILGRKYFNAYCRLTEVGLTRMLMYTH